MGQVKFIVPQLIISVIIQLLCSYSTLPLYAICTQMGSSFKRAMFDEHVQEGLVRWHLKVKNRMGRRATDQGQSPSNTMESANSYTPGIQLQTLNLVVQKDLLEEEDNLEQQVKMMNAGQSFMPHPPMLPTAFTTQGQKLMTLVIGYPSFPVWQFMPSSDVDTTQDAESCPPVT